ncbi:hypothetical protein HanRHA438_Chr08g0342531 [Helianthus annuus]|nr:hypothetical protein HanHA89_Chr08g0290831 [Helianthus annuus]KAJ0897152.1 hypothetical protein HanRHA438_Chr08g0342531 [Helianthus annuus]
MVIMDSETKQTIAPRVPAELRRVRHVVHVPFWCRLANTKVPTVCLKLGEKTKVDYVKTNKEIQAMGRSEGIQAIVEANEFYDEDRMRLYDQLVTGLPYS